MGDVATSDDIANGLCPDIVLENSAATKSSEKNNNKSSLFC